MKTKKPTPVARAIERQKKFEAAMEQAKEEIYLATHKCITCGVVATHPDEAVWNGGIYAGEWNSPQADDVRKLRRERDALTARLADEQEFNGFINARPFDDGWIDEFVKTFVADLPDVQQMASTNLTILAAKMLKDLTVKLAERDKEWLDVLAPGNRDSVFGKQFGTPETYRKIVEASNDQ